MKQRVPRPLPPAAPVPNRFGTTRVTEVLTAEPGSMVTLEDLGAALPEAVHGAFVRLRPAANAPAHDVTDWRSRVAALARAVRVIPPPRDALVPDALARPQGAAAGIVEEARAIAAESTSPALVASVEAIIDRVGSK